MSARSFSLVALLACSVLPVSVAAAAGAGQVSTSALTVPGPDETQELTLRDGSRLYGRVISIEAERVVFRTTGGVEITVDRVEIEAIRAVRGTIVDHEFRLADPNATRLFFGPTARSLPKGHGYIGVYEIILPFVQVGLTDRLSLGVGTPLLFGDDIDRPYWISPKAQVLDRPRAKAAVGLIHISAGGDDQVGIAYGVTTFGRDDAAVTVGAGYAYQAGGKGGGAVITVAGEQRVHRRLKLITENYFWEGGSGLASGGVRFIGDRLSADVGIVVPFGGEGFVAFPVVNFVWVF